MVAKTVDAEDTLEQLKRYVSEYATATDEQRKEGERALDYKAGIQWTAEEKARKDKRNEPTLVFNYMAQKINFLVGSEIRSRVSPRGLPRTPAHEDDRKAVTDALRYVADEQRFDRIRTEMVEELLLPGLGAVVLCVDDSNKKRPKIKLRFVPASRFFYDPHSSQLDYSDAKYMGVATWWDVSDLENDPQYSKAKDVIDQLGSSAESMEDFATDKPEFWSSTDRKRVQVFEIYWQDAGKWKVAHFCHAGFFVEPQSVQYLDEDGNTFCPVVGATAFITRDNVRYSICRNLFDPQDEINHRRSKGLRDVSSKGFVAERGAVLDPNGFSAELAKPDCKAIVEDDALKEGRILIRDATDMAAGQLQLLAEAKAAIGDIGPSSSSITDAASSGREVMARQSIASIEMEPLFDHLRDWSERLFTRIWYLIRQYWTEEIWLRVTDSESREGYKFVGLNRRMTRAQRLQELLQKGVPLDSAVKGIDLEDFEIAEINAWAEERAMMVVVQKLGGISLEQLPPEQQEQIKPQFDALALQIAMTHPQMREQLVVSNVGRLSMDIIIDTAPDVATIQQEQFEILGDMIGKGLFNLPPDIQELAIQASGLRDKDQLIEKIRKRSEQPNQGQQMQMEGQMAMLKAQIGKLMAEIDEIKSQTVLNLAKANAEGPKSMGEQAYAVTTMIDAGRKSVPDMPAMAAGSNKGQGNAA